MKLLNLPVFITAQERLNIFQRQRPQTFKEIQIQGTAFRWKNEGQKAPKGGLLPFKQLNLRIEASLAPILKSLTTALNGSLVSFRAPIGSRIPSDPARIFSNRSSNSISAAALLRLWHLSESDPMSFW
ncbi:hypothetical protein QUC31_014146 [Theobroma cacao]